MSPPSLVVPGRQVVRIEGADRHHLRGKQLLEPHQTVRRGDAGAAYDAGAGRAASRSRPSKQARSAQLAPAAGPADSGSRHPSFEVGTEITQLMSNARNGQFQLRAGARTGGDQFALSPEISIRR
ncbi:MULTISPECIES: hypothetical protein [Paracoccus]|uniref:hypothetical protein n=1 Tax=Paracoccus TaxID=265 RepID=UPI00140E144C|nr:MULTISPECIES: hypothetical protein [Paracoccus]